MIINILFSFFLILIFSSTPVLASFSFNIDNASETTITSGNQELNVKLNITSLPSESYFRVALQKENGGSYFGYILNNNSDWASIQPLSGDCSIYYKITDTLTTSLILKFKMGDDATQENGNYKLKAHRFTKTCTSYTEATNNSSIIVNLPIVSPTPSPSQPSNNPSPTSAPQSTPIKNSSPLASSLRSPVTSPKILGEKGATTSPDITSESNLSSPSPSPESAIDKSQNKNLSLILMSSGTFIILISLSIYLFFKRKKSKYEDFEDNDNN